MPEDFFSWINWLDRATNYSPQLMSKYMMSTAVALLLYNLSCHSDQAKQLLPFELLITIQSGAHINEINLSLSRHIRVHLLSHKIFNSGFVQLNPKALTVIQPHEFPHHHTKCASTVHGTKSLLRKSADEERTELYCTVLYCTVLYCTALYFTVLYCTALYCIVLHCIILYCTVLYFTVF